MLIDGLKFDLRIYVVVTSIYPLRIYVYEEGLARFATEKYKSPTQDDVQHSTFRHLTNYSLNKYNKKGFINTADDQSGSKWTISGLRSFLRANGINDSVLFHKINEIIYKTLLSVEPVLTQAFN